MDANSLFNNPLKLQEWSQIVSLDLQPETNIFFDVYVNKYYLDYYEKYLAEFFGTMFSCCSPAQARWLAGPGLVLVCMSILLYRSRWLSNRMSFKDFVWYVVFQLAGAAVGAGFLVYRR